MSAIRVLVLGRPTKFKLGTQRRQRGPFMPMTHPPETGTENPYRFSAGTKIWYYTENRV